QVGKSVDGNPLTLAGKVYTAVVTGTPEASTIILMDNDGRRVDAHTMNDRTIVDYGYFYNNTLFWVLTLDTSGTVPACTVSTYRPGRRLVGTIADNEQVFYHVLFSAENVTCIGDTYIRTYDYSGTENASRRVLTYGWTLAAADETSNNPLMCFVPNNQYDGTHSMQDIRLIRGTTDAYMRMPFNCEALFCSGNSVYGFSKDGYIMSAAFGDKKAVARQMGIQFEKVLGVTSNGVAMLQQGNVVYFVSYQA
ncbi:MAG: hypothetical protein MJ099_06070, partial [Clostridia bacterium]|nr:hypothetical protein [Clostridia bacterium]